MTRAAKDGNREPLPARGTRTRAKKKQERPLGRPINSDGEETRRRILTVARECFAAYGYAATTNRIIADRAGYTTAAVYHHFGRKNDLMVAVYEATQRQEFTKMHALTEGKKTFYAKIEAILDVTHRVLVDDPSEAVFMFVAREEAKRHAELAQIADDRVFADLFAEIVADAVSAGEVDAAAAKYVRGVLMALTFGLASLGPDVSPAVHRTATEGCKRLLAGTLLPSSQREGMATPATVKPPKSTRNEKDPPVRRIRAQPAKG